MPALRPLALVIGASLLALACAPTNSTSGSSSQASNSSVNQCFFISNISGFSNVQSQSLVLNLADGRNFNVQTLSNCNNLDFATAISVTPEIGLDSLCVGDLAYLHTGMFDPQAFPCQVQIGSVVAQTSTPAAR